MGHAQNGFEYTQQGAASCALLRWRTRLQLYLGKL